MEQTRPSVAPSDSPEDIVRRPQSGRNQKPRFGADLGFEIEAPILSGPVPVALYSRPESSPRGESEVSDSKAEPQLSEHGQWRWDGEKCLPVAIVSIAESLRPRHRQSGTNS